MEDSNTPAADPSISDLRAMLSGTEPTAAAAGATETPAPTKEGEPAPASEPVVNAGSERGPDGKFKAADPAAEPTDTPNVSKRIGKLLAEKRAAEERAEALEAQLQGKTGSQPAASAVTPTAQPAAAAKSKPELKDYDSYDKFNEDLVDWKLAEARATEAQAAESRTAAEREAAAGAAWDERVGKVVAVHPDYEEVMAGAAEMPISAAMNRVIFTMERGPEVAYQLAKRPDECARIAKLDPLAAAAELGAIRAGLAAPKAAASASPAAKVLPKPAANVGGSASPHVIDLNDPKIDMATFKTEFRKRMRAA